MGTSSTKYPREILCIHPQSTVIRKAFHRLGSGLFWTYTRANICSLRPLCIGTGGEGAYYHIVGIGEVSKLIGRSPDTLRRWEKDGLLKPSRDRYGRRVYSADDVERCVVLAKIAPHAQRQSTKLVDYAHGIPTQLSLFKE